MIKRFIVIVAVFFTVVATAQENVASPYSYYGIGLTSFKGTVENRSMGGLSVFSDSIHLNLRNPAAYGRLRRTTYAVGGSHTSANLESDSGKDKAKTTSLDYLAIGVPVGGNLGFGLGVMPYTSVGYQILDIREDVASRLEGRGGMNKVFLSAGYQIIPSLSIGVDANYNFGNLQNRRTLVRDQVQLGTRDVSRSDLSGFTFNFGADFQKKLKNGLKLHAAASYTPTTNIDADNSRQVATIAFSALGERVVEERDVDVPESQLTLPSRYTIGTGIGRPNKWFLGAEYVSTDDNSFLAVNTSGVQNSDFAKASQYKLGGYFIPQYNSLTSYVKRIVYRAGFRYEETGLNLRDEAINEFGITFGVGLPVGPGFSNINLGVEYGQRGTKNSGLIQEDYFRVSVGVSLTEARRWFERRKFN
jgi:long-subunit fatty acid transport protein